MAGNIVQFGDYQDRGFEADGFENLDKGEASELREEKTADSRDEVKLCSLEKGKILVDDEFLSETERVYKESRELRKQAEEVGKSSPIPDSFEYNGRGNQKRAGLFAGLERAMADASNKRSNDELRVANEKLSSELDEEAANLDKSPAYICLRDRLESAVKERENSEEQESEEWLNKLLLAKCQALHTALVIEQAFARVTYERVEFHAKQKSAIELAKRDQPEEVKSQAEQRLTSFSKFTTYVNEASKLGQSFYTSNNNDEAIKTYYFHLLNKYAERASDSTNVAWQGQDQVGDPLSVFCEEAKFIDESTDAWEEVKQVAQEKLDAQGALAAADGEMSTNNGVGAEQKPEDAKFAAQVTNILSEARIRQNAADNMDEQQKKKEKEEELRQLDKDDWYGVAA